MHRGRWTVLAIVLVLVVGGGVALRLTAADTSPAPATKKALAAVAIDVLDLRPTSFDVNPRYDVPVPLGLRLRFHPEGDDGDTHSLYLDVRDAPGDQLECNRYYDCDSWAADAGTYHLRWQEGHPEEDPGIVGLSLLTGDGELRSVTYAGTLVTGDPRELDLPLSVTGDLARLLADDRFSTTTTQEMVDADVRKWPADDGAGDAVPTTPEAVAQWLVQDGVLEPGRGAVAADTSAYGKGAVGVALRSAGRTVTVVLVPPDSAAVPTCGAGWHCAERRGVTTGWKRGVALVIRRTEDAVLIGTVRSRAITDQLPKPAWRYGRAGRDFDALERGFCACTLQTTRAFVDGVELDGFG